MDVQAALDYIVGHKELKNTKIIVLGQSIGGAAAIYVTAKNQGKIDALIVENTFLSIPKLIPSVFPKFPFISYFCHQIWNSEELISGIQLPVLFLSSGKDELVPQAHMRKLYELYSEKQQKVFKTFVDGTHNDIVMQPGYFDKFEDFIKNLKGRGRTLND